MGTSKATKKFEHRHLKDTLERRNGFKKTKQKHQLKQKKKERRAEENGQTLEEAQQDAATRRKPRPADALNEMSVDDFFQGGFEVPELPKSKSKKRARDQDEADSESDSSSDAGGSFTAATVARDNDDGEEEDDDDIEAQLAALAENDPEFHKHLQENDPGLLDGHLAQVDDIDMSDDDEPQRKKQKREAYLSAETVGRWKTAIEEDYSLGIAKQMIVAFRSAVKGETNDEEGDDKPKKKVLYVVAEPEVYHKLVTTAMQLIPAVFQHHVPTQENKGGNTRVPTDHKKFTRISPLIKVYGESIVELLQNLSDASTLRLTLSSILPLLPYLLSFRSIVRDLISSVADVWSTNSNTESTRIAAFLVLRRLASFGHENLVEQVLKAAYQGLVKNSRKTNAYNIAGVNLMKNSAAELWGINTSIGYTTGFLLIRQLAVHLRTSIVNNSKDGYKTIYNWQYVHSLDFWSRVLATHCTTAISELRPLIYPLVQVTLGALRLIPTATYFPLRFQLTRSLLRISIATGTYIPLAAPLYEVLNSAEMRKGTKPGTLKALDFAVIIRAPKNYLRTRVYQDGVGEQIQELLSEFYGLWAKSIAFPELALSTTVMLKRWLKEAQGRNQASGNKNSRVNSALNLLLQKMESNTKFIEEKRSKVDFAPNNRKGVDDFLKDLPVEKTPLGAYLVGQRRQREEKAKLVEQTRQSEAADKKKRQDVEVDDDSDE